MEDNTFRFQKPQTPQPMMTMTGPPENNIVMNVGSRELLKVAEDGFYVRGVKVPADENEAAAVYRAFKQWLAEHALTRNY